MKNDKAELVGHPDPDGGFAITKQKMAALRDFISMAIKGGYAPKGTTESSGVCAIVYGLELGLNPLQALQSVSVINGRPAMFGDAPLALCLKSGLMEGSPQESMEGEGDNLAAICTVKRVNSMPATTRFSVGMAKKAKLWGKPGPWTQYPARMLQVRARAMALRDQFADVLSGIHIGEEARDIPNGIGNGRQAKKVELPIADVITAPEPEPTEVQGSPEPEPEPTPEAEVVVETISKEPADQVQNLIAACNDAGVDVSELDGLPFDSFADDDLTRIATSLAAKLAAN